MDSLQELVDGMTETARVCLRFDRGDGRETSADHSRREVAAEIRDALEGIMGKVQEIVNDLRQVMAEAGKEESDSEEIELASPPNVTNMFAANDTSNRTNSSTAAPRRREMYWDIDDVCIAIQDAKEKLEGYVQTVETYISYRLGYEELLSDFQDLEGLLQEITDGLTDMVDFMPDFESSSEREDHHDTVAEE